MTASCPSRWSNACSAATLPLSVPGRCAGPALDPPPTLVAAAAIVLASLPLSAPFPLPKAAVPDDVLETDGPETPPPELQAPHPSPFRPAPVEIHRRQSPAAPQLP